jgi:hypothetical protein
MAGRGSRKPSFQGTGRMYDPVNSGLSTSKKSRSEAALGVTGGVPGDQYFRQLLNMLQDVDWVVGMLSKRYNERRMDGESGTPTDYHKRLMNVCLKEGRTPEIEDIDPSYFGLNSEMVWWDIFPNLCTSTAADVSYFLLVVFILLLIWKCSEDNNLLVD